MTVFSDDAARLLSVVDRSAVYKRYKRSPSALPPRKFDLDFIVRSWFPRELYKKIAIYKVEFQNEEIRNG